MKLYIAILLAFLTISCQKESLVLDETPSENDLVENVVLNKTVLSVAAHDGSFDDIIDDAGCFSVKFPYSIWYQGELLEILSINDLLVIEPNNSISYQFPISITFSNYIEVQISSENELTAAQASCASNQLFQESIRCLDFVYPIKIALYDIDTATFKTIIINHDRENFQSVSTLIAEQKASLNFPMSIRNHEGMLSQVTSVNELLDLVFATEENCDS